LANESESRYIRPFTLPRPGLYDELGHEGFRVKVRRDRYTGAVTRGPRRDRYTGAVTLEPRRDRYTGAVTRGPRRDRYTGESRP
jgi:hypothetical protein